MEFSVDPHWLRTGEGAMYNETYDVNMAKIISLFRSLNPRLQECALRQITDLAELQNE